MTKRKSFDEKNKHIHKSRKLIIDTVFVRAKKLSPSIKIDGESMI